MSEVVLPRQKCQAATFLTQLFLNFLLAGCAGLCLPHPAASMKKTDSLCSDTRPQRWWHQEGCWCCMEAGRMWWSVPLSPCSHLDWHLSGCGSMAVCSSRKLETNQLSGSSCRQVECLRSPAPMTHVGLYIVHVSLHGSPVMWGTSFMDILD